MPKIFVSYSRRDAAVVGTVASELRARGADVFVDTQELNAGPWMGQLGREIETCDVFLIFVSSNSIQSKWVVAELTYAIKCDRVIVPVVLELVSLSGIFFLDALEQVDFTQWPQRHSPMVKLTRLLRLPRTPLQKVAPIEQPAVERSSGASANAIPEPPVVPMRPEDATEYFFKAIELSEAEPEKALFLFQKVLEIDPDHRDGKTAQLMEETRKRVVPHRIKRLWRQGREAYVEGGWSQVLMHSKDLLDLNPQHAWARYLAQKARANLPCQEDYDSALTAVRQQRWQVATTLMQQVHTNCPDYGDPAAAFKIGPEFAARLQFVYHIPHAEELIGSYPHNLAWSPDNQYVGLCHSKGVDIWDAKLFAQAGQIRPPEKPKASTNPWGAALGPEILRPKRLAWSPHAAHLIAFQHENNSEIWDWSQGKQLYVLPGVDPEWSADGRYLATRYHQLAKATLMIWNADDGQLVVSAPYEYTPAPFCRWHPTKPLIAVRTQEKLLAVLDVEQKQWQLQLKLPSLLADYSRWSPDGQWLACGSRFDLLIFNAAATDGKRNRPREHGSLSAFVWRPDSTYLTFDKHPEALYVWSPDQEAPQQTIVDHARNLRATQSSQSAFDHLSVFPQRETKVSPVDWVWTQDRSVFIEPNEAIVLRSARTLEELAQLTLPGDAKLVRSFVALSPDDTTLLALSTQGLHFARLNFKR